jgi:hypothetical protein
MAKGGRSRKSTTPPVVVWNTIGRKQKRAPLIPKKVAERLKELIIAKNLGPNKRIFPFGYSRARDVVIEAGRLMNIRLNSHDLIENLYG